MSRSFTRKLSVYIYGAGGHGRVIADAVRSRNGVIQYVDDDLSTRWTRPADIPDKSLVVMGIGDNYAREKAVERLQKLEKQLIFPNVHHPTAWKFEDFRESEFFWAQDGQVVMAQAAINSDTSLGRFCIINTGATVDHDCIIGDFAHIAPGVNLCGGVEVGERTLVGVGSCAIPDVKIGKDTIIGAGSVIVSDIPDGVLALGNPCKVIKEIER